MLKIPKKCRSFSQTSLQENHDPNNPKKAAKVKLIQLKKAKEKIEKVLYSDIQEYQIFEENLHNKKDYFCNKESSLISDLFETNRLYNAEKTRSENPLSILLSDFPTQKAFLQTLHNESLQILLLFKKKPIRTRFCELNEEKIKGFQAFFKAKEEEIRRNEEQEMLKEDIQGKIMRNLEYALLLEDCENRLLEGQKALSDLRKESMNLNLSGEMPDYNLKEKKNKKNDLIFNIKVSEENIRVLMGELDSLRKKTENLKKFINQIEIENNMIDFEGNLKNCLNEGKNQWFYIINRSIFGYKELFDEENEIDFDEIQEKQNVLLNEIQRFPNINHKSEIYEVLIEGSKKNKHFKDNLAVFFEFRQDIFEKIKAFYGPFQRKVQIFESEKIKKRGLLLELEEHERSILLFEAENNRHNNNNNQNMIKIKDLLNISSQEKDLLVLIEKSEAETLKINEKRAENQGFLSELLKLEKEGVLSGKEPILIAISNIYETLIKEKALIEDLKENIAIGNNNSEIEPLMELFYSGLNRNFNLLETNRKTEYFHENIEKNLDLYRQKLDFLSNRLDKTKSEHLQEMCLLNEKILSQQLKIEKDQEKIKTLERFIWDVKQENGLKTTQNTKKTEEEEINFNSNPNSVYEILSGEKKTQIPQKTRHKSFCLMKQWENLSRFGNVSINLQVSNDNFQGIRCKNTSFCDFPLQLPKTNNNKKREFKGKILESGLEIFKLTGNDKNSDCLKPRILKIFYKEKKMEVWKRYELGGKEKIAVENNFNFKDLKRFEVEVYLRKNKKEALFKLEVAFMGLLRIKAKEYDEAKEFKTFLKEIGVEEKEMRKMR